MIYPNMPWKMGIIKNIKLKPPALIGLPLASYDVGIANENRPNGIKNTNDDTAIKIAKTFAV
jgi:hypothetical protein